MDCINELRDSLNVHLGWNKARITCFVNMLLALLTVRTVNLNKLGCVVIGEAQLLLFNVNYHFRFATIMIAGSRTLN